MDPGSEFEIDLGYPIYHFITLWSGRYDVVNVGLSLTMKVGTFKQMIVVENWGGYTTYYAPNIGAIKTVFNGKVTMEVTKLVNSLTGAFWCSRFFIGYNRYF